MLIEAVEVRLVTLPLVHPFRSSHGTVDEREVVVLRVETDDGVGWGECGALPEAGYSLETTATAYRWLRRRALPALLGATVEEEPAVFLNRRLPAPEHPMARAAVELALLDARLRPAGTPLATHLGAERDRVPCGIAIGMTETIDELIGAVGRALEDGYQRVKCKIAPGWDLGPIAAVRTEFPDLTLQADANASYSRGDTERLLELDHFDLTCLEQPLGAGDIQGHTNLARLLRTPIALDESVVSLATATAAIAAGACEMLCLKPARVGGYATAKAIHDLCVRTRTPLWCGGMLETGIGRAAALAVAALPGCTLPGDLAASSRYFVPDLTEPFVVESGTMQVPNEPGIGVDVLDDVLDAATTRVERVQR